MKIISVILLFVYSVTTFVGIGVFHCGCTQSQGWVVMATTCPPCSKTAENCCPHGDRHHDEEKNEQENGCQDDDCCSVEYQYLKVDQLNVTHSHDVQAKVLSLFSSPFLSTDGYINGIRNCYAVIKNHSPPGLLKIPLIYIYAQLRL